MSKRIYFLLLPIFFLGLSAFSYHKFYVSIYQVDFIPEKKRIEITARIFMDDLNLALQQEFNIKSQIGEKSESSQDLLFLQKYLGKHLRISIDGKEKVVLFLSKEIENNVMIIYLKINDVKKFRSLKIQNNALLEVYAEQQNIIQTNFYNAKKNYIFTGDYFTENIRIQSN